MSLSSNSWMAIALLVLLSLRTGLAMWRFRKLTGTKRTRTKPSNR